MNKGLKHTFTRSGAYAAGDVVGVAFGMNVNQNANVYEVVLTEGVTTTLSDGEFRLYMFEGAVSVADNQPFAPTRDEISRMVGDGIDLKSPTKIGTTVSIYRKGEFNKGIYLTHQKEVTCVLVMTNAKTLATDSVLKLEVNFVQ